MIRKSWVVTGAVIGCLLGATIGGAIHETKLQQESAREINDAEALAMAQMNRNGLAAIQTLQTFGWDAVGVEKDDVETSWTFAKGSMAIAMTVRDGLVYHSAVEYRVGE